MSILTLGAPVFNIFRRKVLEEDLITAESLKDLDSIISFVKFVGIPFLARFGPNSRDWLIVLPSIHPGAEKYNPITEPFLVEILLLTTAAHFLINVCIARALVSQNGQIQDHKAFLQARLPEIQSLLDDTGVSARLATVKEKYIRLSSSFYSQAANVPEATPQQQEDRKKHGERIRTFKRDIIMPSVEKKAEFVDQLMDEAKEDLRNGARGVSRIPCPPYIEFASDAHRNWLKGISSGKDIVSVSGASRVASNSFTAAATTMEDRINRMAAQGLNMGPKAKSDKLAVLKSVEDILKSTAAILKSVATHSHLASLTDRQNPLVFYHCDEEACPFRLLTKSASNPDLQDHRKTTHPIRKLLVTFLHDLPVEYLAEFEDQGIKSRLVSQVLASSYQASPGYITQVATEADLCVFVNEQEENQEYTRLAAIDCILKIGVSLPITTINWPQKLSFLEPILRRESTFIIQFPCKNCQELLYVASPERQATHDCRGKKNFKSKPTLKRLQEWVRIESFEEMPPLYRLNVFRQLIVPDSVTSKYGYFYCHLQLIIQHVCKVRL